MENNQVENSKEPKQIEFTIEDGTTIPFYVMEQTTIAGVNYLLVTDSEDEEADAYIMKEMLEEESGQNVYEMVDDDHELLAISKVFEELLDDIDIEVQE